MKSKETLLKEYFEDVKQDFRASVRYGIPYFDTDQEAKILASHCIHLCHGAE